MKKILFILSFLITTNVLFAQVHDTIPLKIYGGGGSGGSTDTTSLSNRINLKLAIADTSAMLANYASQINTNITNIASNTFAITLLAPINNPVFTGIIKLSPSDTIATKAYARSVGGGGGGSGTVTNVAALTLGTTGTDLSSTVANGTTTPVITLNVPTASASNRGALSSTDWSTFNGKQSAITLTTTGSSGAATFSGGTLNIPNYASGGGSGTVTSVAKGYGILADGTITTTGTITVDSAALATYFTRRKDSTVSFTTPTQSALKANDNNVMHLTNNESAAGNKTFTGNTILGGSTILNISGGRQFLNQYDTKISQLAQSGSVSTLNVVFIGDSWTISQGFSNPVANYLQNIYGNGGGGYVGANINQPIPSGVTRSRTGTWGDSSRTIGVSLTNAVCTSTSATETFTGLADNLVIHYVLKSGGGSFTYAVDGGTATTINTSNATTAMAFATITGLTARLVHSLVITCTVPSTNGITICGVDFQINSTTGARIHNIGMSGTSTYDWKQPNTALWDTSLTELNPDIVFILLAVNDEAQNTPLLTYNTQLDTLVQRVKVASPLASIVLITPADISNIYTYPMSNYVDQMILVAQKDSVGFINNYKLIGNYTTASLRPIYSGTAHLNNTGYGIIANNILGYLQSTNVTAYQSLIPFSNGLRNYFLTPVTSLTTGTDNTNEGYLSLSNLRSGIANTAQGSASLLSDTSSSYNTSQGYDNLQSLKNGAGGNTSQGAFGLQNLTTGTYNTAIGAYAGNSALTNTYNVFIGYNSGKNASQSTSNINSIAIGANTYTTRSNQIVLGNGTQEVDLLGGIYVPSLSLGYVAKTANYTATGFDQTIDCTSGTFTVTLPTAVNVMTGFGKTYTILNSGTGTITVATTSSQIFTNIVGTPTTLTIPPNGMYSFQSNNANWVVLKPTINYSDLQGTTPIWNQNTTGTAANLTAAALLPSGTTATTQATTDSTAKLETTAGAKQLIAANQSNVVLQRGLSSRGTSINDTLFNYAHVAIYTSASSININADTTDMVEVTALAVGTTFNSPTGVAYYNGQPLTIIVYDNGSAQTLAFGSGFHFSSDKPNPGTTNAGKGIIFNFIYYQPLSEWLCNNITNNF